ncbi:hypothetical protein NEIRO02_1985 [Nematocida sp. AWRm79]|nr:hypothetical protein NEIRO02_1985 [Nematocida sp. AWRm79]
MSRPAEEQSDRMTNILEERIKSALEKKGKEVTPQEMWLASFDLLKETVETMGPYTEECLKISCKYAPEQLGDLANPVRMCLNKISHSTNGNSWSDKGFFTLMLKTVCTPEAYTDQSIIDNIIVLCTVKSPKIRKRAIPVLRRIIIHEESSDTTGGKSITFSKLVMTVEKLSEVNLEHSGRVISILNQFMREITKYGMTESMLNIAVNLQKESKSVSVQAITFAEAILKAVPQELLSTHLMIVEDALSKGSDKEDEICILINYVSDVMRASAGVSLQMGCEFIVSENSAVEEGIKEIIKEHIAKNKKITQAVYESVHNLLLSLKGRISLFTKLIVVLAQYCYNEEDVRMNKSIELIIGNIGVDRFMWSVKEREFFYWLPMIKSAVHSTDIEVFIRRFMPEIEVEKRNEDSTQYEALWSCFPSFCRGMKDSNGVFSHFVRQLPFFLSNNSVTGYIAQGITILIEEAHRNIGADPETITLKTNILKTFSIAIDLFERLVLKFKQTQAENEREALRSFTKVLDSAWQRKYYTNIIDTAFVFTGEFFSGELKPEINRKENDVPAPEKVFIENAPLLEIVAHQYVKDAKFTEGVLRYVISTHLRTQKMGYKVLLALVQSGFCPKSLCDFFLDQRTDDVLFQCSRHLRLSVMYEILKRHNITEGVPLCRLIFEMARAVRTEGGRNRSVSFDIINEMAATYSPGVLDEVAKMIMAGIPGKPVDYQAGAIAILSSLFYQGREKVSIEVVEMAMGIIENLSAENKYAVGKASIGFLSIVLIEMDQINKYLTRALVCLDRIIFHFKLKLSENLKLILRKIVEKKGASVLTPPQTELIKQRSSAYKQEEEQRIVVDGDGKMRIKDQKFIKNNRQKRVKRS